MDVDRAVRVAESLLPGDGPITEESDPRWQTIRAIGECVQEEPEAVWEFVRRWGGDREGTLRHAVAVCLLQELLAQHFDSHFKQTVRLVREDKNFADTFARCARYGQCELPGNAEAFEEMQEFAARFRAPGPRLAR
jgi:hypothetical protein